MRLLIFVLLVPYLAGCVPSVPEKLQNLSPVEIRVVRDGNPVEGVMVSLYSETPQGAMGCSGLTDRQGTALLKTSAQGSTARGVPPGAYKVVLGKDVVWPDDLGDFEKDQLVSEPERKARQNRRDDFLSKNRIVPETLNAPETTPLRLEVEGREKKTLDVELAEF